MSARVPVAALAVAAVVAGCAALAGIREGGRPSDYDIHVANDTTMALGITVNGALVAQAPPGQPTTVAAAALGPLPWDVRAVTASSRIVAQVRVEAQSVGCVDHPDGSRECGGALVLEDLSCGRLVLYVTPVPPSLPAPVPGAGEPGDCEP